MDREYVEFVTPADRAEFVQDLLCDYVLLMGDDGYYGVEYYPRVVAL